MQQMRFSILIETIISFHEFHGLTPPSFFLAELAHLLNAMQCDSTYKILTGKQRLSLSYIKLDTLYYRLRIHLGKAGSDNVCRQNNYPPICLEDFSLNRESIVISLL